MAQTGTGPPDAADLSLESAETMCPEVASPDEIASGAADASGKANAAGCLALDGRTTSVRLARHFATGVCAALTASVRDDVQLCVSELVTNVVLHAGTTGQLRIAVWPDVVRIEVDDQSSDVPQPAGRGRPAGGRGLRIVDALASSWGHRSRAGGKTVWAELSAARPMPVQRARPPG